VRIEAPANVKKMGMSILGRVGRAGGLPAPLLLAALGGAGCWSSHVVARGVGGDAEIAADGSDPDATAARCSCDPGTYVVTLGGDGDAQTLAFPGPHPGPVGANAAGMPPGRQPQPQSPNEPRLLACEPPDRPWAVRQDGQTPALSEVHACAGPDARGPCLRLTSAYSVFRGVYVDRDGRSWSLDDAAFDPEYGLWDVGLGNAVDGAFTVRARSADGVTRLDLSGSYRACMLLLVNLG
jgi:hypothetical protein